MPTYKKHPLTIQAEQEPIEVPDADLLSPSELAQERQALLEERLKREWLADAPAAIARRVPVSVFALGAMAAPE